MSEVIRRLRAEVSDVVIVPGDDQYTDATSPDNSSYPQRPSAVIRPRSTEQVSRAVRGLAGTGATVVVQATGHGTGAPINDGQIVLDTSALTAVTVDPDRRLARIEGGSTWPAVQAALQPHGLLGLSGTSPTVGVAGYTFGGGISWFVRKFGLASGALRAVEYVDGTGRIRRAGEEAADPLDREALWAFRGGAPVGVATALEVVLFPVPELWTGYLLWPENALSEVVSAWTAATGSVSPSVTSTLSLLKLPPAGPFPDELLGKVVVHLSYVSPDGVAPLTVMRDAVRGAAVPAVDTTAPGDLHSLTAIHLDPPAAVPARGMGRWLGAQATEVVRSTFETARIGQPNGLGMIELRHTESQAAGPDGAFTSVPAPFLLHAVGAATDDDARTRIDRALAEVEEASRAADIGRAVPSFREGQPDVADVWATAELDRLRTIRTALDPEGLLAFQRHPVA